MQAKCTRLCAQIFSGCSLLSYEFKFKISVRLELWLRRYLQNNKKHLLFVKTSNPVVAFGGWIS